MLKISRTTYMEATVGDWTLSVDAASGVALVWSVRGDAYVFHGAPEEQPSEWLSSEVESCLDLLGPWCMASDFRGAWEGGLKQSLLDDRMAPRATASGSRKRERPPARDRMILRQYMAGTSVVEIAEEHGISRARVYQIMDRWEGWKP